MNKKELIKYVVGVMQDALEKHFPEHVNLEYLVPEKLLIEQASEIIAEKFKHIQAEMTTAHLVKTKGG